MCPPFDDLTLLFIAPAEHCANLAPQGYLPYVSRLKICQLITVLTGVVFERQKKLSSRGRQFKKVWPY